MPAAGDTFEIAYPAFAGLCRSRGWAVCRSPGSARPLAPACSARMPSSGHAASGLPLLKDSQQVAFAVLEPGPAVLADLGDACRLVEAGEVILLELHATLLEIADLSVGVGDDETHLGVRARCGAAAGEQQEPGTVASRVQSTGRLLLGGCEPELVRVERLGPVQVAARKRGLIPGIR